MSPYEVQPISLHTPIIIACVLLVILVGWALPLLWSFL